MSKSLTEPKVYIVAYIGSKLAAGRHSSIWPYQPVAQDLDGAAQEQVKDWLVGVQESADLDDLKANINASPSVLGEINNLARGELEHYLDYYNDHKPKPGMGE